MTTIINEAKIKVNESWVSLVPDATTSSKGIVQIGDGLSVSNGVISVSGNKVRISNVSTVNNSGFAVSQETYTPVAYSYGSGGTNSSWANYGESFAPIQTSGITHIDYPPFEDVATTRDYVISVTVSGMNTNGMYIYNVLIQAIKESDGTVIGSGNLSVNSGSTEYGPSYASTTLNLTLPSWTTEDKVQIQVKDRYNHVSGGSLTGLSSSGSATTVTYYYKPMAGA